ncbi:hypothetical protein [Microbacterium sp. BF1]|uniref:hypothetical protein n=1 Tax=Microbacterium sp. BF1 TaxID=2821146 RepID=UPI00211A943D|nr:hypothetical protein [Microbacterium sp. BF1]
MSAQTMATAPVRRRRGVNLEKWGWIFMRVSGVVLVVLIFGHLFVNLMVGEGIHALDFAFMTARVAKRAVSTVMRCLSVVRVLNRVS